VVLIGRDAEHVLFGAARLSAGSSDGDAGDTSVRRGNPKVVPMIRFSSVSKFLPVELSSPLLEVDVAVADPVEEPAVDARTVSDR